MPIKRSRIGFIGVALAFAGLAVSAYVAFADSTTLSAKLIETTTFHACPAGTAAGTHCFTGVGHGSITPPVPADPNAVEKFEGFVTATGHDANTVSITTNQGTLFLTTSGQVISASAEMGTWTAHGGTGIFEDASGSGPVNTTVTGLKPDGRLISVTTYSGAINLD